MTAIRPLARSGLRHSPEEYAALVESQQPQLLELRTDAGAVYVRPSRWERLRLQWAFRHFRVLCPELLSQGDLRLIEKLSRSAIVKPAWPVPRDRVFGVVERALPPRRKPPGRVRVVEPWPEKDRVNWAAAGWPEPSRWQMVEESLAAVSGLVVWLSHRRGLQAQKGLAVLAIAFLAVILVKIYGIPGRPAAIETWHSQTLPAGLSPASNSGSGLRVERIPQETGGRTAMAAPRAAATPLIPREHQVPAGPPVPQNATARQNLAPQNLKTGPTRLDVFGDSTSRGRAQAERVANGSAVPALTAPPVQEAPVESMPQTSPAPAIVAGPPLLPQGSTAGNPAGVTAAAPVANPTAAIASSPAVTLASGPSAAPSLAQRPFISELPQGHFAYPAVSDPKFVGTVTLRAVIGIDGTVKDVTVLSGDPKAAQAAVSAVRHWRYAPDEVSGHPIEAVTKIGISFFGRDALSVTSAH